jgi:hypothetical protein
VTGANLEVLQGHTDRVTSVAISPDNNYVFSASSDGTIKVWRNTTTAAAKTVNKMLTKRVISRALREGLVRPKGYFGSTDPGGQEYQSAAQRWPGLAGGRKRRTKTNKKKQTNKKNKKRTAKKTNKKILNTRKTKI